MSRAEAEVEVTNARGLHLRPARTFSQIAESYACKVSVHHGTIEANGKSLISLVTLNAPKGSRLRVVAEGEDAEAAVEALVEHVRQKFGEPS